MKTKELCIFVLLVSLNLTSCLLPPQAQPTLADFGDAPDPTFPSLLVSDGARTLDPSQFWLGSLESPSATLEEDAQVINLDQQDDGLVDLLVANQVMVTFQVAKSEQAPAGLVYFNLLADTNGDGRWQGYTLSTPPETPIDEWVVKNQAINLGAGETARIDAKFPEVRGNLEVWVRASVTDSMVSGNEWDGTGQFQQGEVEDHLIRPDLVWDVECIPEPPEIIHGGEGWLRFFVTGLRIPGSGTPPAPTPTFDLKVTSATGTIGPLGDPLAAQIDEAPRRGGPWDLNVTFFFEPNGIPVPYWDGLGVFVDSKDPEAVHSLPNTDIIIGYFITYELRATQGNWTGIKTGECNLAVIHPAIPPFPPTPTPTPTPPFAFLPPIITDDGFHVAYRGPLEVQAGGTLEATFLILTPEGKPAKGILNASLGDPPSDPRASHASGELDSEGKVTLEFNVNWPAGTTKLYISHEGKVYEVAVIIINP